MNPIQNEESMRQSLANLLTRLLKENQNSRYFIITNPPDHNYCKERPVDDQDYEAIDYDNMTQDEINLINYNNKVKSDAFQLKLNRWYKDRAKYAYFNPETTTWTMELPTWFTNSTSQYKSIYVHYFDYSGANGTLDATTSFHCPALFDGDYNQYDSLVGSSSSLIGRDFPIRSKLEKLEFFFKNWFDERRLDNFEAEQTDEQWTDDDGNLLYYACDPDEYHEQYENPVDTEDYFDDVVRENLIPPMGKEGESYVHTEANAELYPNFPGEIGQEYPYNKDYPAMITIRNYTRFMIICKLTY